MNTPLDQDIQAMAVVSQPRRWMGVCMMALLGALLIYLGFAKPPASIGWQVFLIVLGGVAIAITVKMYAATKLQLFLTEEDLRDSEGHVIARIEDITGVERGAFAIKPSNGFMIRLSKSQPRAWHPGIWWRLGRRVGIGGVIPGSQTRIMAETIQALIAERNG
ncbi:MAG: hypothetical protein R3256_04670 [Thalassovita sp.]|nr:hypothetical protein [Thalassovita sp.]